MSFIVAVSDAIDLTDAQLKAYGVKKMPSRFHAEKSAGRGADFMFRNSVMHEWILRLNEASAGGKTIPEELKKPPEGGLNFDEDYDFLEAQLGRGGKLTQPAQADFESFFDGFAEKGETGLLFLAPAPAACDDYASALKASAATMVKFPKSEIYVVNTRTMSVGMIPSLMCAVKLAAEGASVGEAFVHVRDEAENRRGRLFAVADETTENSRIALKRGYASDENGELKSLFVCKGARSAAEKLAAAAAALNPDAVYAAVNSGSGTLHLRVVERMRELAPAPLAAEVHRMGPLSLALGCSLLFFAAAK